MKHMIVILSLAILAGCWTFNETPYPQTAVTTATETSANRTLALVGFEAMLTEYEAVHGFRTVYVPGYHGRHCCEPGHYEMVPAVDYIPQLRSTDMFVRRAQDEFEKAGFTLSTGLADRTVEVRFEGPCVSNGDDLTKLAWNVFTVFLCDYGTSRWTARLRIRDTKTGKLLFHHDYEQRYETKVFGLIPLIGASSSLAITRSQMQSWCLAALTDRAVADATAFLAGEGK